MIEICNLTRRYGSVQALSHVNLRVEAGCIMGLLGQNGAGKTTLLNILTGYLAPTEGYVLLDGHDPLLEPAMAKRRLGYLPEQPPLYDEMTVQEYLRFAAELKGVARRGIPAHVEEVMALTGLTSMRRRLIGHLSKGYRQRAGMAQALCGDPDILVLDEPTVGLDPKQVTEMRALIRKLGEGRTIVFSSHILSEVQQLCDHVVILDKGKIICKGTPAQLKTEYTCSRLVWYTEPCQEAETLIRELSAQYAYDVDHYNIRFDGNITEFIYAHREQITDYEIIKGSMDDVFLNLTGKELRG